MNNRSERGIKIIVSELLNSTTPHDGGYDVEMISCVQHRILNLVSPAQVGRAAFVAAASGLVFVKNHFYTVSDDEHHFARFSLNQSEPGKVFRLFEGDLPIDHKPRKKRKPDLEGLLWFDDSLIAIPSGSKRHRVRGALIPLDGDLPRESLTVDFSSAYEKLDLEIPDLNIEGAVVFGDELILFQRGNGKAGVNALVHFDVSVVRRDLQKRKFTADGLQSIQKVELGDIDGVAVSFTDACVWSDRILFSAAAEGSKDTYEDGKHFGSVLGVLEKDGNVVGVDRLDIPEKVEGICVIGTSDLFLVTDADDSSKPSVLYRCSLKNGETLGHS